MKAKEVYKWHFNLNEYYSNKLLESVLDGRKKATCTSLISYEKNNEELSEVGDLGIITYFDGTPGCLVRITKVRIMPLNEVTQEILDLVCDPLDIDRWMKSHIEYFKNESKLLNYEYKDNMLVVFDEFEIIEKY